MPIWLQTALTIFYVLWLIGVLIFLFLIWQRGTWHMHQLEQTLIQATMRTAEAAEKASEAAFVLACKKPDNPTQIIEEGVNPLI